jgi:RNA polymerase sigma-70 factor (ECF subfamily)
MAEPADADLIERALGGQRDAFEMIYRRYQAIVYRFARSMTGSAPMAEDVTQEVFVALMRDLARYEPNRASLSTYLYGVARNITRARLRREEQFVKLEHVSSNGSEPVGADDPSAALTRAQDVICLRRAIVGLPSRYREVVILCDLHGLSYAAAADVIDTPVGTVRSRLHRGRGLLIERLRCVTPGRFADLRTCDEVCRMMDRMRNSEVVDLERSLRALADEDYQVQAPPHVHAAVMQAWDVVAPFAQRGHRARSRGAWRVAIGSMVVAAAIVMVMLMVRAPSEPSRAEPVVTREAERPRVINDVADNSTRAPARRPPRSRAGSQTVARRYDPGMVLVADPLLDANAISIVRVRVPRTALATLGILLVEPNDGRPVDLEMLVGEDGVARTIRPAMPLGVRQE